MVFFSLSSIIFLKYFLINKNKKLAASTDGIGQISKPKSQSVYGLDGWDEFKTISWENNKWKRKTLDN